jgi:hypothetical protein
MEQQENAARLREMDGQKTKTEQVEASFRVLMR